MNKNSQENTSPTTQIFSPLEAAHQYFNDTLFDGKLSLCVMNMSRRRQAFGFFIQDVWENKQKEKTDEISLNPDYLNRPAKEAMGTLVHEMCHQYQAAFGNPSPGNYHNKEWAELMESVGLIPSSTGEPGGKKTGRGMTHYIQEDGRFDKAFQQIPDRCLIPWKTQRPDPRLGQTKNLPQKNPKSRLDKVKYSCPSCKLNVWGKLGLQLSCDSCQEKPRLLSTK